MGDDLGLGLKSGDLHYRAYVGPPEDYDLIAAMTFGLLTSLGLRQHHTLLDIGCGSLRSGRLLIPYLNVGHYYGIEPNSWLVEEGIAKEVGQSLIHIKQPHFIFSDSSKNLRGDHIFDFALAQSIFTHCGIDQLETWLAEVSRLLKPTGAFLATFLFKEGASERKGWIYPECVEYPVKIIESLARKYSFDFRILDWRHPRQTWVMFSSPKFDLSWLINRQLCWNTWLDFAPK